MNSSPNTPTCIQTVVGHYVDLLNPTPESINLEDIIVASNRIRRFTGHSDITLAEHSCRVHDIVRYHLGVKDGRVLRAALLHDAHEAYVGDASSPLKIAMRDVTNDIHDRSDYDFIESGLADAVAQRFDFDYPHPAVVKEADTLALAVEADLTWGAGTAESWGLDAPPEGFGDFLNDMRARLERTYT